MNQIFGHQILPERISSNDIVFEGTQAVSPSTNFNLEPPQVKIFAHPHSHLQSCFSEKYKAYTYVWGIPAHPEITTNDIPEWCANVVAEERYERFKELIGTFVIIVDSSARHRITFVTDILGLRPMFMGRHNGRIVFGSDVWSIYRAGLSTGIIDYDSVSVWVAYNYNCTDGTLFSDLRRLSPGSAITVQNNQCTEVQYAKFETESKAPKIEQVAEEIHHIVSSAIKPLLANHKRIFVPLSGGYDSRYLLALSMLLGKNSIECATVSFTEAEGHVAHRVAETLGVPLKTYGVKGSLWNFYDEVYHFMADGFPISKFVQHRLAQDYAGIPMLNGFMGDILIRGYSDKFEGKYETEWEENLVGVLQRRYLKNVFRLFRKDITRRILVRSRIPWEKAVSEGAVGGKVFCWNEFYNIHRILVTNNFLQHIGQSEALIPFYSWPLLSYKMKHDYRVFNEDTYRRIFQRYFPELANIPHASDLPAKKRQYIGAARCTKQWAKQLLPVLCNKKWLSLLTKKLCIPLDMAFIAGLRRTESSIFVFERLYLLEKRIRDAGLDFDWECI